MLSPSSVSPGRRPPTLPAGGSASFSEAPCNVPEPAHGQVSPLSPPPQAGTARLRVEQALEDAKTPIAEKIKNVLLQIARRDRRRAAANLANVASGSYLTLVRWGQATHKIIEALDKLPEPQRHPIENLIGRTNFQRKRKPGSY